MKWRLFEHRITKSFLITQNGFRRPVNNHGFVRFEVSMAVTMKNIVFLDVAPCGSYKNRRFGGTCRLNRQGRRNNANEEVL
jgi:hypothetical protein